MEITREQFRERAREKVKSLEFSITQTAFADSRAELEEELELARIALASLEAEPVALRDERSGSGGISKRPGFKDLPHGTPLFTAPPAPVSVPEPIKRNDADGWWMYKGRRVGGGCAEWYNRALDDCRAAMLQGAEPVTPAYKSPDDFDFDRFNDVVWLEAVASNPHMHSLTTSTIAMVALELNRKLADCNSPVIPDGWVACSERMPETMVSVLVTGTWFHHSVAFWDGLSWCDLDFEQPVTHWMPLPAAPQQEVKP